MIKSSQEFISETQYMKHQSRRKHLKKKYKKITTVRRGSKPNCQQYTAGATEQMHSTKKKLNMLIISFQKCAKFINDNFCLLEDYEI